MPEDNVLIRVNTVAGMAGIDAVKGGLLGLSGPLLALTLLLGALYKVGKDGQENFHKQEDATNSLTQAYATQHETLDAHKQAIEDFLRTNADFISDQYDTQVAMANLVRSGMDTTKALRVLGDALDLAAIKHIPVTEAQKILLLGLMGNKKGLKDLGISTADYDEIVKNKTLTTGEKQKKLLDLIESKTRKGRDVTDDSARAQNALTKAWQDFTTETAPGVDKALTGINRALATGVDLLTLTVKYLDLVGKTPVADQASRGRVGSSGSGSGSRPKVNPGDGLSDRASGTAINVYVSGMADGPTIDRMTNAIAQRLRMTTGI